VSRDFNGKVVLITGATSGIGRATALAFADSGASVVVGDIRERPIGNHPPTAEAIKAAGGKALFVPTDVTQKPQVESFVRRAVQEFGRVDILVNNAGIGHISLVNHTPEHLVRRMVEVNFYGVVFGVQAVLQVMQSQGYGHIINISSGAAMLGLPYASIYSATKAAVMRFSEALRYELEGSGIQVSAIFPDLTSTDLALEVTLGAGEPTQTLRLLNRSRSNHGLLEHVKLQSPENVARAVVECAVCPRAEVYLSHRIRLNDLFRRIFPSLVEREARLIRTSVRALIQGNRKGGESSRAL